MKSKTTTHIEIEIDGHCTITDDLGNTLLDETNAIHPQNMARILSRGLANEPNSIIHAVALGNGGTVVDSAFQISYQVPNDGQSPDPANWESRLYNETYREIIDESNTLIGTGIGSVSASDPASVEHVSGPGVRSSEGPGFFAQTTIEMVLNKNEPTGQLASDNNFPVENTEGDFTFDELGLYSSGAPHVATAGFQNVNVSDKNISSDTGLAVATLYTFSIQVDGGLIQNVNITTPGTGSGTGGEILYSDILPLINTEITNSVASITDVGSNVQTFGFLKFTSNTTGSTSSILLEPSVTGTLFSNLAGFQSPLPTPIAGLNQGVQNDPINPTTERERLLTHLIFSPILKAATREYIIKYILTLKISRNI